MVRVTILSRPTPVIPDPVTVKYGLLYNFYAATDVLNICAAGWTVPTATEFDTLITYLGGVTVAGGKLKEPGLIYWTTPNTGATNEVNFNGRGNGARNDTTGLFSNINLAGNFWTQTAVSTDNARYRNIVYNSAIVAVPFNSKKYGFSIRPFRAATVAEQLAADGTSMNPYIGNDNKSYRTVKIGTQVWLADNLAETKFRTGATISEVTDNSAWAALTTAGMCAYNNDWSNVLI